MVVGLLLCGLVWVAATVILAGVKRQDAEFHRQVVAPALERAKERTNEAGEEIGSFNNRHEMTYALDAWVERMARHSPYMLLKLYAFAGGVGVMILGSIALAINNAKISRLRASPTRPADQGAGEFTKRFSAVNKSVHAQAATVPKRHRKLLLLLGAVAIGVTGFVAAGSSVEIRWAVAITLLFFASLCGLFWWADKSRGGDGRMSVEVDMKAGRITFRHFTFIVKFAGNRRLPETVLEIRDFLEVSPYSDRNGRAIKVRTTQGTVILFDRLQNFAVVEALLYDFVEINRLDSDGYHEALRREPKITTPWWGWLILAFIIGGLIGFIWLIIAFTGPNPPSWG